MKVYETNTEEFLDFLKENNLSEKFIEWKFKQDPKSTEWGCGRVMHKGTDDEYTCGVNGRCPLCTSSTRSELPDNLNKTSKNAKYKNS